MFDTVLVRDWMTHSVITITPDASISSAHQIMKEHGIRRLPVLADNNLVGIVTFGDVREASPSDATTLSIWELNYLWAQLIVDKIMTRNVLTVHPDTPILDAAELMLDQKVSGLPVVDTANRLVGMITESDIFRMLVTSRSTIKA
jgi:acetoin utilization protein AcuB